MASPELIGGESISVHLYFSKILFRYLWGEKKLPMEFNFPINTLLKLLIRVEAANDFTRLSTSGVSFDYRANIIHFKTASFMRYSQNRTGWVPVTAPTHIRTTRTSRSSWTRPDAPDPAPSVQLAFIAAPCRDDPDPPGSSMSRSDTQWPGLTW